MGTTSHVYGAAINTPDSTQSVFESAIRKIVEALARVLLKHGIQYPAFAEIAKQAFVTVATNEHGLREGRQASKSRVALLTGVNRRDVARVQKYMAEGGQPPVYNPLIQLTAHWIRDEAYLDENNEPLELEVLGPEPSLDSLRARACPDIPITAVIRELLKMGLIKSIDEDETRPGRVRLADRGYLPHESIPAKIDLMGSDVAALIQTIGWNIENPYLPQFQRKVSFNNLSEEGVLRLHQMAPDAIMELLVKFDGELGKYVEEDPNGGEFAGLGIYVFSESGRRTADDLAAERKKARRRKPAKSTEPT